MKNMIKPVIVLTVIAFVCTAALAGVNSITKEIIQAAAEEKSAQTKKELIDDSVFNPVSVAEETLKKYSATALTESEKGLGYIAEVSSKGYGGEIQMMVAFTPKGEVIGVKILSAEETKGVGTKALENSYLAQFENKSAVDGGGIDAVSGATITSNAVTMGVNNACNLFNETVLNGGGK